MNFAMSRTDAASTYLRYTCRAFRTVTCVLLLTGCTGLPAPHVSTQATYVLEAQQAVKRASIRRDTVLAVSEPEARPGFDTPQIAYLQHTHELNYFVASQWADTPAHMLQPLLVQAMEQTGSFRAVVQIPSLVPADIRLDTELVRLRQDFTAQPSRVQLTLRAQLIDVRGQRVLAVKQFDEFENATSENAYGGVSAANRALQRLLDQLADFCVTESAAN